MHYLGSFTSKKPESYWSLENIMINCPSVCVSCVVQVFNKYQKGIKAINSVTHIENDLLLNIKMHPESH